MNDKTTAATVKMLPFKTRGGVSELEIDFQVVLVRSFKKIRVEYQIRGNGLKKIHFGNLNASQNREDSLWKHTCFELFLAPEKGSSYWEFNFAPSGDWNVYQFGDYRKGQMPEKNITSISTSSVGDQTSADFRFSLELDLSSILPGEMSETQISALQLGLTAILELQDSALTYWAAVHKGAKPDFHLRESFVVGLK